MDIDESSEAYQETAGNVDVAEEEEQANENQNEEEVNDTNFHLKSNHI